MEKIGFCRSFGQVLGRIENTSSYQAATCLSGTRWCVQLIFLELKVGDMSGTCVAVAQVRHGWMRLIEDTRVLSYPRMRT